MQQPYSRRPVAYLCCLFPPKGTTVDHGPAPIHPPLLQLRLNLQLDWVLPAWTRRFRNSHLELTQSTQKTHRAAMTNFNAFCVPCNFAHPFPISECSLSCLVSYLMKKGFTPQSIQMYLLAVSYTQVVMGFPDPHEHSPSFKEGLGRDQRFLAMEHPHQQQLRLSITMSVLKSIRHWLDSLMQLERELMWAVASMAFTGFLIPLGRAAPAEQGCLCTFDPPELGDVATNSRHQPTVLKIHLRQSKCDQFGCGIDVFVGRIVNKLFSVVTLLTYFEVRIVSGAEC